ncbi:MAG: hemerythrin domain-containing protein [Candidatus Devosia phytovorans]|uniref:Hemerythrin domain-containing protein n=1 Tax=Candidatus Devosia phytovorans TaxID=3121372 RepID=A0AAJ5VYS8_9HYPH|nr:hemerythrin domain-containing protein [Devosia sp.]WEK06670.1 MAG: hemerythrin domain-containing protein [Devosia sp.]
MLDIVSGSSLRDVMAGHAEQIRLCQTLESIADSLPREIDVALCRDAASAILPIMTRVVQSEQEALTQELAERGPSRMIDLTATVSRILRENAEDLSYAEELQETLRELAEGSRSVSTDALGYMLRSFFESRRRRIALEREILTALAAPDR